MAKYDLSSTELDEFQNHDDFIIIWMSSTDLPSQIKQTFVDYLKYFHSYDHCIKYINEIKSERKILLILTDFECLSNFHDFIQIQSIYLYNKISVFDKINKEIYPKLIDQFTDLDHLISRLRKDILLTHRIDLPVNISSINEITIEQSLINLQGNLMKFLWNQFLLYYLVKSSNLDMNNLKKIMIEQCRIEYEKNPRELDRIREFEQNCSLENVLQWYTKDSFLYRLLNKAFRTQNVEIICKFQYFLILLYKKFQDLSKEQNNNPSIVYRGQKLSEQVSKNLEKNIGNFISTTTLLSTSRHESVARSFISGSTQSVIYHIHIPNKTYQSWKPFIDITNFSLFTQENEVLFFLGNVFSIDSVRKENDFLWIIELTLQNQICESIERLIEHFREYIYEFPKLHDLFMKTDDDRMIDNYYHMLTNHLFPFYRNPVVILYIHLAFFFSNFGFYAKAIELYREGLTINDIPIDDPISKVLHIIIGYLYYHLGDYENAFLYYAISLSLIDETNLLICEVYNHIGDVWLKIGSNDFALSCYEQALIIANHRDIPSLTNIYKNVIMIYSEKRNDEQVSFYRKQQEEMDESNYHLEVSTLDTLDLLEEVEKQLNRCENPPSIRRIDFLYQSGLRYMKDGHFDRSLASFLQAKDLILQEPPSWHRFPQLLSTLYDNIAWLYLFRHDYLKTLIMWKRSIDIRYTFYSSYSI